MSDAIPSVAAGMALEHDCAHDAAGKAMSPIDIIRAASAAADVIEPPIDAIELYTSHLRTDWRDNSSIPAAVVAHYAEKVQSFACIIDDYRCSIYHALELVERMYHAGANFDG